MTEIVASDGGRGVKGTRPGWEGTPASFALGKTLVLWGFGPEMLWTGIGSVFTILDQV